MRRFVRGLWRLIAFPFRGLRAASQFMNMEPEERPLGDVFVELVQSAESREGLWEQLGAFRAHLLRALLGVAVGVGIAFLFAPTLIDFLAAPIGGLGQLKAIEVTESVGVFMKAAMLGGIAIALPYVVFEFWLFAAPGLRPRERWYGLIGIPLAALFFVSGIAFTYYVLLPSVLPFLLNFLGIRAELRPQAYFGFVTGLMFWIGTAFEFPLVIYVLTAIGLVRPQPLLSNWRIAVMIIAIAGAAITPTVDPVNMGLVMIPMILLYFVSIGLSYIAYSGRRRLAERFITERERRELQGS